MNSEQPYLLFAGSIYYADGGWRDFRGCYATIEEALTMLQPGTKVMEDIAGGPFEEHIHWYHIVDIRTRTIVAQSRNQAY